jgi:hypothetical protein
MTAAWPGGQLFSQRPSRRGPVGCYVWQMGENLSLDDIDQLVEQGAYEAAHQALAGTDEADESFLVVRTKLALREGQLSPAAAMQKLLQLMRKDPNAAGAKALYQEASRLSFSGGASSTSHSHPPPRVTPKN